MPRSTTPNLEPFIPSIAKEIVKAAGDRLPSAGEVRRLSHRMRELEKQVRKLNHRGTGLGAHHPHRNGLLG